jgi:hypothetical protein
MLACCQPLHGPLHAPHRMDDKRVRQIHLL